MKTSKIDYQNSQPLLPPAAIPIKTPPCTCTSTIASSTGTKICNPFRRIFNAIVSFFLRIVTPLLDCFFKRSIKLSVQIEVKPAPAPLSVQSKPPAAVQSLPVNLFDQLRKPTSLEVEKIDFLLNHLAKASYSSLIWNRSKLESDGELLRQNLSPLRFLEQILLYKFEELKIMARDENRFVWPKFIKNLHLSLSDASKSPAFDGELLGFAKKFQLSPDTLKLLINNNKRADLVKYIINNTKLI